MLIWKTQTLNVNVASLRYRALLPMKYLAKPLARKGIAQTIVGSIDPVTLTPETTAIIFVKSFRDQDVETCRQTHYLGVPIILDLCDNIFIAEYATDSDYVPAKNFRKMARYADAIVTTGDALKVQIEAAVAPLNIAATVIVIPDPSEQLTDIDDVFRSTRIQRLWSLQVRPAQRRVRAAIGKTIWLVRTLVSLAKRSIEKRLGIAQNTDCEADLLSQQRALAAITFGLSYRWQSDWQPAIAPKMPVKSKMSVQTTPLIQQKWPEASSETKTILWFGNHGAKYGSFGMESILDVAAAVKKLSCEIPLRLVVVSNSRDKYQHYVDPLPFDTDYLRWHPRAIYNYIRASDVTIIPNSQSIYSICKSANRAVLSLSQGTPVVASRTPALDLFTDCIVLDDWEAGLRQYLLKPEIGAQHVEVAQRTIAQHLSGEKIAQQWLDLLETVTHQDCAA